MTSSSTPPRCTNHVFLSFRGKDTRKAFTDHLYTALLGSGFRTFRDNDGIERCENVKSELDNAIRESRRHVILPVFYDVDPSQVRKQMGSFAEAFGRHEERFMGETNERKEEYLRKKVEGWRAALREVADLAGMVLQNQADGHEQVLVVLDDVDQRDQFDAIIGMRNWFHPGSKIILTTRHKQLLKANEVYMMHKVERFDDDESLELFSWHAFGQDRPIDCYVEHSKRVVQHYGGLPLALQVLGSLSGKSLNIWENAIRKLAIEIVRRESPKEPGKRSRLWHNNDSFNVLRDKTGTDSIEGLFLDMHVLGEGNCSMTSFGVNNAKRPRFEELSDKSLLADQGNSLKRHCFGFFSWHPINIGVRNSNQVELETDAFARMHKLRLLQLNYVETTRGYKDFPKRLRWLCWHGFPLKSIPRDQVAGIIEFLNLSHSYGLTNNPNFNGLPNLENLILKDCINLVEVHESIGKLGRLVFLNLKGCKNLEKLPSKIGHLTSLEKLILSGCSKLDQLLELGKMKYLTVLHADGTAINRIATTTSEDKSWSSLFWSWGMFKLEPIGNAGAEMINNLGLVDLESMGRLEGLQMKNEEKKIKRKDNSRRAAV
ncbi:unnamed protein product [Camellia sinensis]